MGNWSVRSRLIGSFTLVIAVIAGLAAYTFDRLGAIRRQATDITADSMPVLILITEVDVLIRESGSLALMRNPSISAAEIKQFDDQIDGDRRRLDELMRQFEPTILESEERPLFDALKRDLPLVAAADHACRDAGVAAGGSAATLRQQLAAAQEKLAADVAAFRSTRSARPSQRQSRKEEGRVKGEG